MSEEIPFDYNAIDTHQLAPFSDQAVLDRIKGCKIGTVHGYGVIAEVCKRLEKAQSGKCPECGGAFKQTGEHAYQCESCGLWLGGG
ncbi:MAG TPA: hypothetical protein VIY48_04260 [Candidatus Paceibacterota bacterium]